MGVSVANPSTGGAAVSPGTSVQTSTPAVGASARAGTGGVSVPTGQTGPPGKSAYDVAVDNGFVGTEEQWLAEVEGDQGPVGPQGPQGEPGTAEIPDLLDLTIIFENGLL